MVIYWEDMWGGGLVGFRRGLTRLLYTGRRAAPFFPVPFRELRIKRNRWKICTIMGSTAYVMRDSSLKGSPSAAEVSYADVSKRSFMYRGGK